MAKCWICSENEADSGEHAIKQSLLKFFHGAGPYPKGNRLVKIYDDKKTIVQSTDSKFLKFKKTICSHCNNAYSKPWDEEFDLFIFRLIPFWSVELREGYFNLKNSHPGCERKHSNYLYRYFCKIFGCALADAGKEVPQDIIEAVNGRNYSNNMGITLCLDKELYDKEITPQMLCRTFDLGGVNITHVNYQWGLTIGFLKIGIWYNSPLDIVVGEQWYGKSKRIGFIVNV